MRELTQTSLDPGNCWQTCIAMLLDVEPSSMPPQELFPEKRGVDRKTYAGHFSYSNALNAYLMTHHGLVYFEVEPWKFRALGPVQGLHLISGETVRTPVNKSDHVVMGRDGEVVWDPHPSRDGLTKVKFFEFVARPNESIRQHWTTDGPDKDRAAWARHRGSPEDPECNAFITTLCCCPSCFVDGDYRQ